MLSTALSAALVFIAPAVQAESILQLGGSAGWAAFNSRTGISEVDRLRNKPVLTLSSSLPASGEAGSLSLSFDDAGSGAVSTRMDAYRVTIPSTVSIVGPLRARAGNGAVLFAGSDPGISVEPASPEALLYSGNRVGDFSIEFWLYPANMENGEQLLSWSASRRSNTGEAVFQRFRCLVARNRIEWSFSDFFSSPDETRRLPISLGSRSLVVPKTWSHHLLRFDSSIGLVEYLIDDQLESVAYATTTGTERGEAFSPIAGSDGVLVIGPRYTGMLDEFRISGDLSDKKRNSRYPAEGGRAETRMLDLGTSNAETILLEAKTAEPGNSAAFFFLRASESPDFRAGKDLDWIPVQDGKPLSEGLRGRWLQIAVTLYPDGDGEQSPILEELTVHYEQDAPPPPPSNVTAEIRDGAVELRWRPSPDPDLGGYLIYYGGARGEYFGNSSSAGSSPIDVGQRTSFVVDGLRNGGLYYFAIAAYDRAPARHIGEFSREVSARPARTVR